MMDGGVQGLAAGPLTKGAVLDSWGEWLSQTWDWSWWVTLTYDAEKLVKGSTSHSGVGWSRSRDDWDRWFAGSVLDGLPLDGSYWVRGREPNPYRYGTHFHALIGGLPAGLSRRSAWNQWFTDHGHARIEPYNPDWGAGRYLSKYVVKELGDVQFSADLGRYKKVVVNDG